MKQTQHNKAITKTQQVDYNPPGFIDRAKDFLYLPHLFYDIFIRKNGLGNLGVYY